MKSSLFQFNFWDIRSIGAAEEFDGKKILKKFYVGHCRLQVTCTVQAEKTNAPRVRQVKKAWHMSVRSYAT